MSDDFMMKCPLCKSETKYIVRHIVHCSDHVNQAAFKAQFHIYKEDKRKKDQVNRKRKSRAIQRAQSEKKYKENQAKEKRETLAKQRAEDEAKVKEDQVNRKKVGQIKEQRMKPKLR